ncbi:MAG: DUF4191 domain-containing protein [Actinomycetes bacterium]
MRERLQTIVRAFHLTREVDDKLVPLLLAAVLVPVALGVSVAAITGGWILWPLLGLLTGLVVALSVFGRRVQRAQMTAIEGQPGAAAAILQQMRGQWFVTPAVAFTRKQELVHRVVGRPGIVLVAEGDSRTKLEQLLAQEKKKLVRVAGDVPVHTVSVGRGEGQVELTKLQLHLTRLGVEVSKKDVPKLARKLAPLDKGNIPIPKGYIGKPSKKQR